MLILSGKTKGSKKMEVETKKCKGHCPSCGANEENIEWGLFIEDVFPYQSAECMLCKCTFMEMYKNKKYAYTILEEVLEDE